MAHFSCYQMNEIGKCRSSFKWILHNVAVLYKWTYLNNYKLRQIIPLLPIEAKNTINLQKLYNSIVKIKFININKMIEIIFSIV